MAGAGRRGSMMNRGGSFPNQRNGSRPMPRRGQVKRAIVVGLATSVASIFSRKIRFHGSPHSLIGLNESRNY